MFGRRAAAVSPPEFDSAIDTRPATAFDGPEKLSELGPNSETQVSGIRERVDIHSHSVKF